MYVDIADALDWARDDARVNVVIVTGAGDYFSSGADLKDKDVQKYYGIPSAEAPVGRFMRAFHHFPKPVIAAVNGPAVGVGVTLLPHCDVVYCTQNATFWTPFGRIAVAPEFGSSVLFARIMGPSIANEMLLGMRKLTAADACACGLVGRVYPTKEAVLAAADKLAGDMVAMPFAQRSLTLYKGQIKGPARAEIDAVLANEFLILDERAEKGEMMEAVMMMMQQARAAKKAKKKARSKL